MLDEITRQNRHDSSLTYFAGGNIPLILKATLVFFRETRETPVRGQGSIMAKSLKFVFQFPPIQGFFDTGYGVIYIFGQMHENEIVSTIVHETLHHVLLRVAGKRASLKLDNIYQETDC